MLAVVSHDAGGAEILSSFVRRNKPKCLFVLDGPARGIFERKLGPLAQTPLKDALRRSTKVLCGSSWQSDLEFTAIKLSRSLGKPSMTFLDHWVYYAERFNRLGETCLPDEILVGDAYAEKIAGSVFPTLPVRLTDNPYTQDLLDELDRISIARSPSPRRISVLYVCEPVRIHALMQHGDERYWGYTEEDALRFFLSNTDALGLPLDRIVLRTHPSESPEKYRWARSAFDLPIVSGGSQSLIEEIAACDVVVGCESMAMVVGLLAKKRVISCIPPGGRICALPQDEIEDLKRLL